MICVPCSEATRPPRGPPQRLYSYGQGARQRPGRRRPASLLAVNRPGRAAEPIAAAPRRRSLSPLLFEPVIRAWVVFRPACRLKARGEPTLGTQYPLANRTAVRGSFHCSSPSPFCGSCRPARKNKAPVCLSLGGVDEPGRVASNKPAVINYVVQRKKARPVWASLRKVRALLTNCWQGQPIFRPMHLSAGSPSTADCRRTNACPSEDSPAS